MHFWKSSSSWDLYTRQRVHKKLPVALSGCPRSLWEPVRCWRGGMGGFLSLETAEGYKPFGQHSSRSITNYHCGVCAEISYRLCVCVFPYTSVCYSHTWLSDLNTCFPSAGDPLVWWHDEFRFFFFYRLHELTESVICFASQSAVQWVRLLASQSRLKQAGMKVWWWDRNRLVELWTENYWSVYFDFWFYSLQLQWYDRGRIIAPFN